MYIEYWKENAISKWIHGYFFFSSSDFAHSTADCRGIISRNSQCFWIVLSDYVWCSAQSNGWWDTNWNSATCQTWMWTWTTRTTITERHPSVYCSWGMFHSLIFVQHENIFLGCNWNFWFGLFDEILQVKRSIMLKMADACQRAGGQQTRFHEMHVQRHNNVTILYADIVNFTPLSEQLTASDLVKTLNELFGRFDQIAQVSKHHVSFCCINSKFLFCIEFSISSFTEFISGKSMFAHQNSWRLLLLCVWASDKPTTACCKLRKHGTSNDWSNKVNSHYRELQLNTFPLLIQLKHTQTHTKWKTPNAIIHKIYEIIFKQHKV